MSLCDLINLPLLCRPHGRQSSLGRFKVFLPPSPPLGAAGPDLPLGITKDEYNNKEYSFGEVIDNMGDVEFKFEEINFDDDPEIIIAYKNTDRFYDRALEDFINL